MVVLSRSRSSVLSAAKTAPRLAVPPPLNLPSLRKEHERFDPASAGSTAGHGSSGLGSGSGSSAMGWSKPVLPPPASVLEKESGPVGQSQLRRTVGSGDRGAYTPPGARPGAQPLPAAPAQEFLEKAVILRGEDFPSLRATFTAASKQKEGANQKQKQKQKQAGGELVERRAEQPESCVLLEMRPHMRSSLLVTSNAAEHNGGTSPSTCTSEQAHKYLPGPLPLVRLQHTSNWADDERDTGLSLPERERGRGLSRFESMQVLDIAEVGSIASREFFKGDSFGMDLKAANTISRDFGSWRFQLQPKDRFSSREFGMDRDRPDGRPFSGSREIGSEGFNGQPPFGDSGRDGFNIGSQGSQYDKWDLGSPGKIQNGKVAVEAFSGKGYEQNTRGQYGDHSNNWYRGSSFQNGAVSKGQLSLGNKGTLSKPLMTFAREKWLASDGGKPYLDDVGLDSKDPFLGGIADVNVKVFKKKKDSLKQAEFQDPVRESFEAELERILRMQEQERQQMMEEQARAMELARKEEEDRQKLIREEEERRRLLEEEAREAAWRAEQERLESARRAEELRIVREEEKMRYQMEDERRKEAARQKLMELEARIARRQAEEKAKDDRFSSFAFAGNDAVMERDVPRVTEAGNWEDGERMVARITNSASSDSSSMNRYFDGGSRPHSSKDGNSSFFDRGKHSYYSSTFPFQDQENAHQSPRRDEFGSRKSFPNKDFHGATGELAARPPPKGATVEPSQAPDNYRQSRQQKWNNIRDSDQIKRNSDIDTEFLQSDRFGDIGWVPGNLHGSPHASYGERLFHNSDVDGFSSTRYRQFLRQPRVLPPPSMTSLQRNSFRAPSERASSSSFMDKEVHYDQQGRNELRNLQTGHGDVYQEDVGKHITMTLVEEGIRSEEKVEKITARCDSQSSVSISSPPSSPTPLSHDEIDVAGDSPALPHSADGERTVLSDNEHVDSEIEGDSLRMTSSRSVTPGEVDEWGVGNNNEDMQEQEEYDEEDDDYQDIDEHHEGDDENLDLGEELDNMQSDVQNTTGEMEQVILGFDEGVEVKIPSNNEFEITSRNSEKELRRVADTANDMEELISNSVNTLPGILVDTSMTIINDTEKAMQDLTLDVVTTASYPANSVEASLSSGMAASNSMLPAANLPMTSASSVLSILPSSSTIVSQGEAPIKLQFGLFSGPSLIPSPVPAIQIGSIQMPIHLHMQINPSLPQLQPSQPPLFQFGQLRCQPPISQTILSVAPPTVSFVQPHSPASYSFNQNPAISLHNQTTPDSSSQNCSEDGGNSSSLAKQPGIIPDVLGPLLKNSEYKQLNALADPGKNSTLLSQSHTEPSISENKTTADSVSQAEHFGNNVSTVKKSYRPIGSKKDSQVQPYPEQQTSRFFSGEKAPDAISGGRGKRYAYSISNTRSRLSLQGSEISQTDSDGFQRRQRRNFHKTEFRIRENVERKQIQGTEPLDRFEQEERPNVNDIVFGISIRNVGKKDAFLSRPTKIMAESDNLNLGSSISQLVSSDGKTSKSLASMEKSHAGKSNMKLSGNSEEDVDAPLQSGIVRVFKQPGIETPSDEDDFIEVRSKRQMLNDRREQREKENKSKSRATKAPRKQHAVRHSNTATPTSQKAVAPVGGDPAKTVCSNSPVTDERVSSKLEAPLAFSSNVPSRTLSPIGTLSALNLVSEKIPNNLKSSQTISYHAVSTDSSKPGKFLVSKSVTPANPALPISSWDSENISQQVMTLTQTQLEEAMKPAQFDSHVASNIALEPMKAISSILTQEKSFASSTSPISSLLAGEKIQFGAVTSPTILPSVNRAISNGLGPPGSCWTEVKTGQNLPAVSNDCTMFFVKERHSGESCANLEDPEAEAEAAASAVAVAAISNDENVGPSIGTSSASSTLGPKSFSTADATGLTSGGVASGREVIGLSANEESLTIALPADLSVDTPSLSLWPPLPSPQASGQAPSHFPGALPSHFPCFEMNPVLGGHIFAYGPHDESASSQGQSQRNAGAWPQCHSGVESFYGPQTGFTGPFISPGGIPGVQGPPHMVVYNHFAPVGQFGQLGLSFMGTTYIPAGKQPEWKQSQVCSAVSENEGHLNNVNVVSGQGTSGSMAAPIQHLGPGSPLMPVASPLTMFDISPFQSSADMPMQAHWSHLPAPPLHSVPLPVPLQQHHVEGGIPSQFNQNLPIDTTNGKNRFHEPRSSAPGDVIKNVQAQNSAASHLSDKLGSVDQPTPCASMQATRPPYSGASGNSNKVPKATARSNVASVADNGEIGASSCNSSSQTTGPASKPQQTASPGQQYHNQGGYAGQLGGVPQKAGSVGEWHHRRAGFQGRNQGSGVDKNSGPSKMKQIYVAKPSTGGH